MEFSEKFINDPLEEPPRKKVKLWDSEYDSSSKENVILEPLGEVIQIMHQKERKIKLCSFKNNKGLATCRTILVEWMLEVCSAFGFEILTTHTAIFLLDRILQQMEPSRSQLQLIACCCILISAKLDEKDEQIPTIEELNYCTEHAYTNDMILRMEAVVLHQLQWDICSVTPIHFLRVYTPFIIGPSDYCDEDDFSDVILIKREIENDASLFIDLCVREHTFLDYLPSMLASSSIALARKNKKLYPTWSEELMRITSYQMQDLNQCIENIWSFNQEQSNSRS